MKKIIFISGWAGYKNIFSGFNSNIEFIVPFIDMMPADIIDHILSSKSKTVAGWSTGANILLSHLNKLDSNIEKIFLFSPFEKFTTYTNPKILKIMKRKLSTFPEKVINDFYKNCGIKSPIEQRNIKNDIKLLLSGLDYLINCDADTELRDKKILSDIHLFHGKFDKIVPKEASEILHNKLTGSTLNIFETEHYISGNVIQEVINENIS